MECCLGERGEGDRACDLLGDEPCFQYLPPQSFSRTGLESGEAMALAARMYIYRGRELIKSGLEWRGGYLLTKSSVTGDIWPL